MHVEEEGWVRLEGGGFHYKGISRKKKIAYSISLFLFLAIIIILIIT